MIESSYINFLKKYSGKNIDEVINILNEENKKEKEAEEERLNNRKEYFNSLLNKYFIIDFNGVSFIVLHVDHIPSGTTDVFEVYNILKETNHISLQKEKRTIPNTWFLNPFDKDIYSKAVRNIIEISETEYNHIVEVYNETVNKIKNLF